MNPDPLPASGRAARPQSWNRYSYVLNNPLRLTAPSGLIDTETEGQQPKPQPNTEEPPPPPPADFKQIQPINIVLPEHEDGGAVVGAGVERIRTTLPNQAADILLGVRDDSYYNYYPEAAYNAVESRTGTEEPSGTSSQQTQSESAGALGTISKQPAASANVGVTTATTATQNSAILPRLQGEIDRRVTTLTVNDRAIHKLTKISVTVVHAGRSYTVKIGLQQATQLVANASGLGQMQANQSARNANTTVP